ncbi:LytTR family transcriptional regulator DNA-binding domain-containing protein [Parabacteroides goldsteinii]|jgi:DNA-binding LytR/AlgR family response regulator
MDVLIFKENTFVCSYNGGLITVAYEDLLAIECDKPLVRLRLKENTISVTTTLCKISNQLRIPFVRVNRQVIVNMALAKQLVGSKDGYWILLQGDLLYKISARQVKSVRLSFIKYT